MIYNLRGTNSDMHDFMVGVGNRRLIETKNFLRAMEVYEGACAIADETGEEAVLASCPDSLDTGEYYDILIYRG